jgi:hypothetical protein
MSSQITEVNPEVQAGFERFLDQSEVPVATENSSDSESQDSAPAEVEPNREEARLEDQESGPEPVSAQAEDELAPEGDESAEGADEQAAAAPESGDNDVIDTVADLAASFEIEENEFLEHLQIAGRDGEESVSLSTMVDHYRNAPAETEAARTEIETERTNLRASSDQFLTRLQDVTARIVARVDQQREPDGGWEKLRASNPAEYIRLRELEQSDRAQASEAIGLMREETDRRSKEDDAKYDVYVREEANKTFRLRPEWKTPAVAKAAHDDINSYLTNHGFEQEQIDQLVDANSIICVWKAAQYDKQQAAKPGVRKRLSKLPRKHLRTTARDETVRNVARDKQRKDVSDKFRQSGKIEDALALFGEHV